MLRQGFTILLHFAFLECLFGSFSDLLGHSLQFLSHVYF